MKLKDIRFEVIDENGRQYVKYNCIVDFQFQDNNKTLKIICKNNMKKENKVKKELAKKLRKGLRLNCPSSKIITPKPKRKEKHKKDYFDD
jgi:hypothetical protein